MKQVSIAAKIRTARGSAQTRRLRAEGLVPAELYGHKETNQSIAVNGKDLNKILAASRGENVFFVLNVDGAKGEAPLAIIKELQYDKIKSSIIHADFHKVNMNEKIRIKVPVKIVNGDIADGVKEGGTLQIFMRTLEVYCLPNQTPESIQVDVLSLKVGEVIHISDLKLPEGVKATQDGVSVIVSVAAQAAEEVKAEAAPGAAVAGAPAAAGAAEPEVITAKKKEEGAADAKAPAAGDKKAAEKK
ncbi:MAG TPA: 50S ribosomal protein L25 [bacterium]|nr:50S ribosomal protein L25 [bacterium]